MNPPNLALWAEITIAVLVLAGAALALLGSIGLLRLPTFFERVHAPAIIATSACWCIVYGSVLFFSLQAGELALHPILIALLIAITTPITTIFLMRASLFRARKMGKDVPPNISRPLPADPRNP
ncbi:multisubunit potassium/proton antiporter, PhaG subunit [Polaromonas sp. OV174]|uniref:monovalent cation/H(+) antiporter subunit G n=1 Tax=Polaromonas sp. OV174 TaxID=1855300 RepID=UPI0008E1D171|nr:monovalent cation/H(+) antiporter subunit G [Polaromonas sp. OV174]SFB75280.1 multisubunit potassium/proton antiporter, PhaG subunit [Polaromonas sp. OV174]